MGHWVSMNTWVSKSLGPIKRDLTDPLQMVSELIDHTTASWDVQNLHVVFYPFDVEAILNVPLCTWRKGDF